jgi:hypothetical protein
MPGFFWTRYYPCKPWNNGGVLRLDRGRSGYDSSSSSLTEESALAADVRKCFGISVMESLSAGARFPDGLTFCGNWLRLNVNPCCRWPRELANPRFTGPNIRPDIQPVPQVGASL